MPHLKVEGQTFQSALYLQRRMQTCLMWWFCQWLVLRYGLTENEPFFFCLEVRNLKPLLTVSFISGDISLMNNYDDLAPHVIRSGLKGKQVKWSWVIITMSLITGKSEYCTKWEMRTNEQINHWLFRASSTAHIYQGFDYFCEGILFMLTLCGRKSKQLYFSICVLHYFF